MPGWVKAVLDEWLQAANLTAGRLFRRINKNGKAWGEGLTEKSVWHAVREYARKASIERLAPHDLRGHVPGSVMPQVANSNRFSSPRARLDSDYRAVPGLQAAHSSRR
jgi:hypothetical protein